MKEGEGGAGGAGGGGARDALDVVKRVWRGDERAGEEGRANLDVFIFIFRFFLFFFGGARLELEKVYMMYDPWLIG